MIEQALFAFLRQSSALDSLVGANIFPVVVPQKIPGGALRVPALVYNLTAANRDVGYCGTVGTVERVVSIDAYALTYLAAQELAVAVRRALIDYRGHMGGLVWVVAASLVSEFDAIDIDPGLYRVNQTWSIWYKEI